MVEFGLATNRKFKAANGEDREEVCFVDCSAFGKTAEVINQYCQKGRPLFIEGRLKFDSWEDKQGGGKRSKLSVVVENFQFLGGREGGGGARARIPVVEKIRPGRLRGRRNEMRLRRRRRRRVRRRNRRSATSSISMKAIFPFKDQYYAKCEIIVEREH